MKKIDINDLSSIEIELLHKATVVRECAFVPFSDFKVGTALLADDGNIYTGCNIESATYTLTSHAESVAIDSMVKSGCLNFSVILIVIRGELLPGLPCGLCLQKISEFSKAESNKIIIVNLDSQDSLISIYESDISTLLPFRFSAANLMDKP